MNHIKLTAKEKSILENRHQLCHDKKESNRVEAILLRSEKSSIGGGCDPKYSAHVHNIKIEPKMVRLLNTVISKALLKIDNL